MKQATQPRPFMAEIVGQRSARPLPAPFEDDAEVELFQLYCARHPEMPAPDFSFHSWHNTVATLLLLAQGQASLRLIEGSDPALSAEVPTDGGTCRFLYRLGSNMLYSCGWAPQSPEALVLFAARLLLRPDSAPDFSAAYRDLLAGLANGLPRPELTGLLLSAAEALEAAGISVLKLDDETSKTIWFYGVRLGRDGVGELDATSTDALDLDARFSNLSSFEAHLAQVDMLIK